MTNSNLRTENHFDYVKITLASPDRVMEWGQRTLPNGQVVGEVTKLRPAGFPQLSALPLKRMVNQNTLLHCSRKLLP